MSVLSFAFSSILYSLSLLLCFSIQSKSGSKVTAMSGMGLRELQRPWGATTAADGSFIHWFSWGGLRWKNLPPFFYQSCRGRAALDVLLIHCGGNDLQDLSSVSLIAVMKEDLHLLHLQNPGMKIIFSGITHRCRWKAGANPGKLDKARRFLNSVMATDVHC